MSKIIDAIYPRSSRYSINFQAYARALNLQLTHTYFFGFITLSIKAHLDITPSYGGFQNIVSRQIFQNIE